MKTSTLISTRKGFTLVELIVSMAVFIIILVIAAQTFDTIIKQASKFAKIEESNVEGVVGLEVLRHDLEQTGFGLFWGLLPSHTLTYPEADTANWPADTTNYAKTNDINGAPPRALVGFNAFSVFNSDLLSIKATTVGQSNASQRWTYIPYNNYSTSSGLGSRPVTLPAYNLQAGDRVVAIRNNFNNSDDDRLLIDRSGAFSFSYNTTGGILDDYLPTDPLQLHMIYGIKSPGSPVQEPRMPFNRADYFVRVPTVGLPKYCSENTGTLYKGNIQHDDGTYGVQIPLLDCVADMQVVLGWSFNAGEGKAQDSVHVFSSMPATDYSVSVVPAAGVSISASAVAADIKNWLQDPKALREHLKMVKVYILVQEGKRDAGYTYPSATMVIGDASNGETTLTNTYTFTAEQRHFRWKLYSIIVRPKNLVSNQR